MKKSMILTGLLLVLTMGAAIGITLRIGEGAEDLTISEKVVYGDRAKAEGLHVTWNSSCYDSDYLAWKTEYAIGKNVVSNTEFTFGGEAEREYEYEDSFYLDFGVDIDIIGEIQLSDCEETKNLEALIQAVSERTADGEIHTERVYLKDYLSYYPVDFYPSFYNRFLMQEGLNSILRDYFKIPVRDDHLVEITLEKNSSGELIGISVETLSDNLEKEMDCQVMEDGIYLLLAGNFQMEDLAQSVKTESNVTSGETHFSGSGLYYLPFCTPDEVIESSLPAVTIDKNRIIKVYPLGSYNSVLEQSADGNDLELFSQENNDMVMTVFDAKSVKKKQQVKLFDNTSGVSVFVYEDFQVVCESDGRFIVLVPDEQGMYQETIRSNIHEIEHLEDYLYEDCDYRLHIKDMDYRDGKLVLITYTNTGANLIAVYDASGLIYLGCYGLESRDPSVLNGIGSDYISYGEDAKDLIIQWKE